MFCPLCQSIQKGVRKESEWFGVHGDFGCSSGKVYFEATVGSLIATNFQTETGSKTKPFPVRIGFGSKSSKQCGNDALSFGYAGSGRFVWNGQSAKFGPKLRNRYHSWKDTVTAAIDFDAKRVYFAVNGQIISPKRCLLSDPARGGMLYPMASGQNAEIEFNFDAPRFPCRWLIRRGFVNLYQAMADRDQLGMAPSCKMCHGVVGSVHSGF